MALRILTLSLLASTTLAAGAQIQGAAAQSAAVQTVAALVGDRTIAIVDAAAKKVTRTMTVGGISGRLAGIDVRPADGMLYGVVEDGTVVTIDTRSGKATMKSRLEMMIPPGTAATVDFNPVADRLRLMGTDGMNLRANVDDGKVVRDGQLRFADGDMHKGETPMVTAGAYTNSFKGTKETVLYDIDGKIGALLRQAPPNDGVLNAIGKLGVKADKAAFDIVSDGQGGNAAWLMAGGTLYKVDLATGKATKAAEIKGVKGTVRDIAALPKMM
ncbi:lipoprotein [Allostella vacuolata]|nr:lipoprotein [Stella vacuolata]